MNTTMTTTYISDLDLNSTTGYDLHLNLTTTYLNDLHLNFRENRGELDCDMECIWNRYRKSRTPILRPLTFFLSIIGIVGILGNTLVIIVFARTVQKRTSTYLVLMLAIIDLIACAIVIPGTLLKEWSFEFKSDLVCKLWELMRHFAIISSAMILAAIAFDRFLLVYRRLQNGNKHLTMAMILVAVVSSIALGVPPMLGVGVYMESFDGGLINIKVCMPNDQYISAEGLFLYWQIVTGLFGILIITIVSFYTLIFAMVYRHSARITSNSMNKSACPRQTSTQSKIQKQGINVLPFIGLPKSEQQTTYQINSSKPQMATFLPVTLLKAKRLFRKSKQTSPSKDNQVVAIKVIQNSASSVSSLSLGEDNNYTIKNPNPLTVQGTSKLMLEPEASTGRKLRQGHKNTSSKMLSVVAKSHDQVSQKALGSTIKQSTHNATAKSTNHSQYQQMRNQSAHVKTTQVLCIITTVYIISFLPMFLITHQVLGKNVIIFYLYFINNAANPIIYSFMNKKFRQDICKMFSCKSNRIWTG